MAVEQLPVQVREFARYLSGLTQRLDQGGGWCGVFWQRDPDGMRACLEGWEVPPWDVVEALLQDLAGEYGDRAAAQESERIRALHDAALAAYDARPGGRDALGDRLDVMLREQRYAAERQVELGRLLHSAGSQEEAESIRLDLAWAHDDHDRATARCAELRHRMDSLDRRALRTHAQGALSFPPPAAEDVFRVPRSEGPGPSTARRGPGGGPTHPSAPEPAPRHRPTIPEQTGPHSAIADPAAPDWPGTTRLGARDGAGPYSAVPDRPHAWDDTGSYSPFADPSAPDQPATARPEAPQPPEPAPATPKQRSKRRPRGSARFAGMMEQETAPEVVPEAAAPPAPTAPGGGRTPRGARFAGVAAEPAAPRREPLDDEARRVIAETVGTLTRLRGEGRSGEAHALLVEAAYWPAARFPLLAAQLHRAGLDADWATLLWEAASLPADRLVAAADALVAAGRTADGQQMLRQGVVRPAPEIGAAVLGLAEDGRRREIRALLGAYVRVRTPEEAARSAEADPQRLVPLLLEAAQGVSQERHWDLVHALRVAGFTV